MSVSAENASEARKEVFFQMWNETVSVLRDKYKYRDEQIGVVALFMLGFYYHSGDTIAIAQSVKELSSQYLEGDEYRFSVLQNPQFSYTIPKDVFDSFSFTPELSKFLMDQSHKWFRIRTPKSLAIATESQRTESAHSITTGTQRKVRGN